MSKDLDKALKDYESIFDRPSPIRYNVLHFSDDHRRMDALLRRHYNAFHPLVRDIFTSFSLEFSILLEKVENMEVEMKQFYEELDGKRKILDDELDDRIKELRVENDELKEKLQEKDLRIEEYQTEIRQLNKILKEKEALIVTQRRQLDLYIDKETRLIKEHEKQKETIYESIEHVNEFTSELEKIEVDMRNLETTRIELEQENDLLKHKLTETEEQYMTEIDEITKVYSQLKVEFSNLLNKYEVLEVGKQDLVLKLEQASSRDEIESLQDHNQELQLKIIDLENALKDQIKSNGEMRGKIEKFREMASKIIEIKQKLEDKEIKVQPSADNDLHGEPQIVHPSNNSTTRKWSKQKTPLEMEIEGNASEPQDQEEIDEYQLQEKDLNLDSSISRISSKFEELDSGNAIISSMKVEEQKKEVEGDYTNRLMEELQKYDYLTDNEEIIPETKNFQKVLQHLEGEDVSMLDNFAKDFPLPPESKEIKEKRDKEEKNTQKNTALKS